MLKNKLPFFINYVKNKGGLPAGYTQVEYVKNTSSTLPEGSCIPLGVYADVDDMEYEIKVEAIGGDWYMLCTKGKNSGGSTIYEGIRGTSSSSRLIGGFPNGNNLQFNNAKSSGKTYLITLKYKNGEGTFAYENLTDDTRDSGTKTYTYYNSNAELKLFMQVSSGNKVYYVKIKKAGVLVLDLVPAIDSNNVAGFYDMVSKTFKIGLDTSKYSGPDVE